jgi:hypothetical protein
MASILGLRFITTTLSVFIVLLSACSPNEMVTSPSMPEPQSTSSSVAPAISPVPFRTLSTRSPVVVTPSPPPSAFPTDIYPDPVKRSSTEATFFDWCPNPIGLQQVVELTAEVAIALINDFHSGNVQTLKHVTDPAMWPVYDQYAYTADQIDRSCLDGPIQPANKSAYAGVLAQQCGQETIDYSWTARICPEPCFDNTSASLVADYFFLNRGGVFLIWFIWP